MIVVALAGRQVGRIPAVEPHVDAPPQNLAVKGEVWPTGMDATLTEADIVVPLVDHAEFRAISSGDLSVNKVTDTRVLWR